MEKLTRIALLNQNRYGLSKDGDIYKECFVREKTENEKKMEMQFKERFTNYVFEKYGVYDEDAYENILKSSNSWVERFGYLDEYGYYILKDTGSHVYLERFTTNMFDEAVKRFESNKTNLNNKSRKLK